MLNQPEPLDRVFFGLADPTRRAMLERLSRGPATVSELAAPLPISLPSVVQHLQVLELSGLVRSAKQGRVRTCRLDADAFARAEAWLARQRAVWEARLDRLDASLQELQSREEARDPDPPEPG